MTASFPVRRRGGRRRGFLRRLHEHVRTHRRAWTATAATLPALGCLVWATAFLKPGAWRYYTDDVSFRHLARDVQPGTVLWSEPVPTEGRANRPSDGFEPTLSPDGTRMVFTRGLAGGNADLYLCRWDGRAWGPPEPLRALNSPFHERSPAFSRDAELLFFASDRPGGAGGFDIWVARWDGAGFAWPLPLTGMVNSEFDELGPDCGRAGRALYFSSNRPRRSLSDREQALDGKALRERFADRDHDLFEAALIPAGVTNREVERAQSMLYYLRESALGDPEVMRKLGGSAATEKAVDRALEWLTRNQETNGQWSIVRHGGLAGHDVAATSFALLAFFGRGERHDRPGTYREPVAKGLAWLVSAQNELSGDLRGARPPAQGLYDQAIGSLALAEAYGLTKDEMLYLPAQTAIDFLADAQNGQDGGWRYWPGEAGDMSVSGWVVLALKSAELSGLHVPERTYEGVRRWLKSVSYGEAGGLYRYQPRHSEDWGGMIATGYFCSQLMGMSPNTPRAFETAAYLRGKTMQHTSDIYYGYYATLAAYQNQGPTWRAWSEALREALLAAQHGDGSWLLPENHGHEMGRVIATALAALSLQAHYRYTPLYGLGFEPWPDAGRVSTRDRDAAAPVPAYRRARRLNDICSPADDVQPAPSAHGDFLYFASSRRGGRGGLDLYRCRRRGAVWAEPANLGRFVNSGSDDTDPALCMGGFRLLFGSNRGLDDPARYRWYTAMSRRVFRREARGALPSLGWVASHFAGRCTLLALSAAIFAGCLLGALPAAGRRVLRRYRGESGARRRRKA